MAKIKFGMMMTDASGKLGGQVFSKNRGGSYVRTKTTPSNPQTSKQMAIRGAFASISSGWSSLTEAERLSFNNLVGAYAQTDIFGDLRNPSGKALYQRLNQNLTISGQATVTVCPEPAQVPFALLLSADGNATGNTFTATYNGDVTGSKVIVWATPPMSQGTAFVKNKLRQIDVNPGANAGTVDFFDAYTQRFGALSAGQNIHIGIRVINANGQASPLEVVKAVIS